MEHFKPKKRTMHVWCVLTKEESWEWKNHKRASAKKAIKKILEIAKSRNQEVLRITTADYKIIYRIEDQYRKNGKPRKNIRKVKNRVFDFAIKGQHRVYPKGTWKKPYINTIEKETEDWNWAIMAFPAEQTLTANSLI